MARLVSESIQEFSSMGPLGIGGIVEGEGITKDLRIETSKRGTCSCTYCGKEGFRARKKVADSNEASSGSCCNHSKRR